MLSDESIKAKIIQKLQEFDIQGQKAYNEKYPPPFRTAAILMPLKVCNGEVFILLTKRAKSLRSHASQVALPGGMTDDSDSSAIETALREADEEIGLSPSSVEVISVLSRGISLRKIIIYPVVGLIPSDFKPNINPSEVEFAFFMPLKDFLCEEKVYKNIFHLKFVNIVNRDVWYKDGDREVKVWGFTSAFCTFLAKIILDKADYLDLHVGCKNTGRISDCTAEYFQLIYNWILSDSCCKL